MTWSTETGAVIQGPDRCMVIKNGEYVSTYRSTEI